MMLVVAGDMTKAAFAKKHRRAKETLYKWIDALETGTLEVGVEVVPRAVPSPTPEIEDDLMERIAFGSSTWMAIEGYQQELDKRLIDEFEVTINIDDDEPILIVWLSDLHIGHVSTDMQRLRFDLEKIKATPGAYVIFGGDLLDNVTSEKSGRGSYHEQITRVDIQRELAEEAVSYLGGDRVLALLLGNHENWSATSNDFDPVRHISEQTGAPYLGAFGYINVGLGNQEYRILCAHQFRSGSNINKTASPKKLMDEMGDADAVFTGHRHDAAVEHTRVRRFNRFFAQSGTYMKRSNYGRQKSYYDATPEMPGVVLYPDRRKFIGVYNALEEGVEILNLLRGGRVQAA